MAASKKKARLARTQERIKAAERQLGEYQRVLAYDTKEFTVELLVQKFGGGGDDDDIYIPPYQRKFSWDEPRQSRFIESVLMGLPIPFLFFGDMGDGRLEVVDGTQRLSTCRNFLTGHLQLVECERLTALDGFSFADLSLPEQRRFKNRTIRAVVLSQKATEADRRDLFDRINTGSLIAQPAEVRRGKLLGKITDLIDELGADPTLVKLCPMSEPSVRRRARENLVARFFAFSENVADDLPGYKDRIGEYLDTWLTRANARAKTKPTETSKLRNRFRRVMTFVAKHFPHGFAKQSGAGFTPNVRFDAIAVGVAEAFRLKPHFKLSKPVSEWLDSDEFVTLTTSNAANVRSKVTARIEYVRDQLLGAPT